MEVLFLKSDHVEVRRIAECHLPLLETLGDTRQLSFALSFYSLALGNADELTKAEAVAQRAVDMAERVGDVRARAYASIPLLSWAQIMHRHPLDVAKQHGERLLKDSKACGDNYALNCAYFCLASEYIRRGLPNQARDWAQTLLDSGRERGDPRALGLAYWMLSWVETLEENYQAAIWNAEQAMQAVVTPYDRIIAAAMKASAEILHDRVEQGFEQIQQLRKRAREIGLLYFEQEMQPIEAIGMMRMGRIRAGLRSLESSISARKSAGDRSGAMWRRRALAEIYVAMLTGRELPAFRVVLKNLGILVWVKVFGVRRVQSLLNEAGGNEHIQEYSTFRAHQYMLQGLLWKLQKQPSRARDLLEKARTIAESQSAGSMIRKINTALSTL